ncbi:MAG: thiamine biosynthesis protein ApbE [Flavobacteriaceae bacterium]|nr:MAG: thiamine biosynthesis protein ApbE [Flavobacteriaceae bacterium]
MGNAFEFAIQSTDNLWANAQIDLAIEEIRRIERLLTTFSNDSITSIVNQNAGIEPVEVPQEVFELIFRCQKISELTQGAFDITYGGIDKSLWNFDLKMKTLPSAEVAAKSVRLIDYQKIVLDQMNRTVFLKEKGMRIGFGGIGKGYAADKATELLKKSGVVSGFVNAAGDLNTWGVQENGKPWTIGVADPNQKKEIFSSLDITNAAIATSGNYEKYVTIGGKRYSHTIDPKTGLPVSGIKSVTIITQNAELADALATPVMVMGIKVGLDLINQLKGVGCIVIDDNNKLFLSKNININQ